MSKGTTVDHWYIMKVREMSRSEMVGLLEDHGIECYSYENHRDVELNLLYHLARGTVTFPVDTDEGLTL